MVEPEDRDRALVVNFDLQCPPLRHLTYPLHAGEDDDLQCLGFVMR